MRAFIYTFLSSLLLCGQLHAQEEWEKAAVEGITAINTGDGDKLTKISHPEYKKKFKESMLRLYKTFPENDALDMCKKVYGMRDLTSVAALAENDFMRISITENFKNGSPEMQEILRTAKFRSLGSIKKDDIYHVTIEVTFTTNGQEQKSNIVLYAKQDGDVWKYFGDPETLKD